ncbi:PEP/pyruvate-binding domain-containing protein [Massilia glaciei]|nr:PEP/pyruvate-binding domain-containing protein [Massilia glaciei]
MTPTPALAGLIPLAEAHDASVHGGKAAALARMLAHGFRVPPGVVLTDALFQDHLRRADAGGEQRAARICASPLAPTLRAALGACIDGTALHAVRSSAVGEDSAAHSFAGQLDTVLGVAGAGALEDAVRTVWASAWSVRSLVYQARRQVQLSRMGVIVQRQIDARHAGVLFTHAPAGCAATPVMMIEYCAGLGDALVSGAIDPARVVVAREGGGIVEHVMPDAALALLAGDEIHHLVAEASRLEALFGCPLDIEWAIDQAGQLWLLQARPISTPVAAAPFAEARSAVWTNANIAENFPEPVSPLLYSVVRAGYTAYFRNLGLGFGISPTRIAAMAPVLANLVGVHGGRLYYNLSNIHALLQLAPAGRWLARAFNNFVGAAEMPALRHAMPIQGWFDRVAEALRIPCKTAWQYLRVQSRVARFERAVTSFCDGTRRPALAAMSPAGLVDALDGFLTIRLRRWNDAALADTAAMVCYALLQRSLKRAWPQAGESVHNNLLVGLPELASHVPVERLWDLSREVRNNPVLLLLFSEHDVPAIENALATLPELAAFRARFEDYLERWGFRSSGELMLTHPSTEENPHQALNLLKTYVGLDADSPATLLARQVAARLAATDAACKHLSPLALVRALPLVGRAGRFRLLLSATQGAIRLRERARMQQARLYVHLRHIVLACGRSLAAAGLLDAPEDAFQLTMDELKDLLSGQAMFPYSVGALVRQRREAHARLARMAPPDSITMAEGSYLACAAGLPAAGPEADAAAPLQGTGACGGRISATAAVLADATEVGLMHEGDIVVTRQTDPGWACVFFLARGLVVERGGMLSHGAIIAREFGIPAVVGVRGATTRIRSGARLMLDGDRGVVEILA